VRIEEKTRAVRGMEASLRIITEDRDIAKKQNRDDSFILSKNKISIESHD